MEQWDEIFKWLSILGRLGNLYVDHRMGGERVKGSHHPLLFCVCRRPGVAQEELVKLLYIHPSNITRGLDCLEREGYIRREYLPEDRRTRRIYPTAQGERVYRQMCRVVEDWGTLLTGGMGDGEAAQFSQLLGQAGHAATAHFFPSEQQVPGKYRRGSAEKS